MKLLENRIGNMKLKNRIVMGPMGQLVKLMVAIVAKEFAISRNALKAVLV